MPGRACSGRVALVTGASQGGTGTAIAIRLAAEGAAVAITARSEEGLEETQRRIEAIGGTCIVLPADLSHPSGGRSELVSRTEAALGPIDILVNNAAANGYHPFEEVTARALERCLQVNLWAPWELMQAVVPGMRERRQGWVLNLTSFAAELPPGPAVSAEPAGNGGLPIRRVEGRPQPPHGHRRQRVLRSGHRRERPDPASGHRHAEPGSCRLDRQRHVRTTRDHG